MPHALFRTIALATAAAAAGCATLDRAGQDGLVVASFPVHALTTPLKQTRLEIEDGASPWAGPAIMLGKLAEDVGVTLISVGDLGISPVLGVVELASHDPDTIRPLDMYKFEGEFPPKFNVRRARDVESDVVEGMVVTTFVVAVLVAEGYAQSQSDATQAR